MQVRTSWAERFMNYFPYHTKLYSRRGKNGYKETVMRKELFDDLVPFFRPVEELERENERLREAGLALLKAVYVGDGKVVCPKAIIGPVRLMVSALKKTKELTAREDNDTTDTEIAE